jgi:hypothetical protein
MSLPIDTVTGAGYPPIATSPTSAAVPTSHPVAAPSSFSAPPPPAPVSAPPANAPIEFPLHLDDFLRSHARDIGPELRGMYRHWAREQGHLTDTISGFIRSIHEFRQQPTK